MLIILLLCNFFVLGCKNQLQYLVDRPVFLTSLWTFIDRLVNYPLDALTIDFLIQVTVILIESVGLASHEDIRNLRSDVIGSSLLIDLHPLQVLQIKVLSLFGEVSAFEGVTIDKKQGVDYPRLNELVFKEGNKVFGWEDVTCIVKSKKQLIQLLISNIFKVLQRNIGSLDISGICLNFRFILLYFFAIETGFVRKHIGQ